MGYYIETDKGWYWLNDDGTAEPAAEHIEKVKVQEQDAQRETAQNDNEDKASE